MEAAWNVAESSLIAAYLSMWREGNEGLLSSGHTLLSGIRGSVLVFYCDWGLAHIENRKFRPLPYLFDRDEQGRTHPLHSHTQAGFVSLARYRSSHSNKVTVIWSQELLYWTQHFNRQTNRRLSLSPVDSGNQLCHNVSLCQAVNLLSMSSVLSWVTLKIRWGWIYISYVSAGSPKTN